MTRDPISLFRTLHRRLSSSDRAVEVQAAQVVEVVRRLVLMGKIEALRRMAEVGIGEIESPAEIVSALDRVRFNDEVNP